MIQAKVVADSLNEFGNRLTTLLVTMPRYILAEFNTHRMLSKNSASSRAIPFEKNLKSVMENPFIPVAWMKDHKGMQGNEYFEADNGFIRAWIGAMNNAAAVAKTMNEFGVTKQMCNRLLEPFMWHTVLVSGTEWENFFALRCPQYTIVSSGEQFKGEGYNVYEPSKKKWLEQVGIRKHPEDNPIPNSIIEWQKINRGQADIHMMLTAEAIWDAMNESTPRKLKAGQWHIPFRDKIDPNRVHELELGENETDEEIIFKIATARCAQTSYTVIGEDEKELNYEKLIALHDRLSKSGHWSPFEHCAKAMSFTEFEEHAHCYNFEDKYIQLNGYSGNFRGFIQYRKMFANENITK